MRLHKITVTVVGVVSVLMMLWQARVHADVMPHYQSVVLQKATRALEHGHHQRAIDLLEKRVTQAGQNRFRREGYELLCRAYLLETNYTVAEIACETALISGGLAGAWSNHNNRGLSRLFLRKFDKAVADLQTAQEMNPREKAVQRNLFLAEQAREAQSVELSGLR